MNYPSCIHTHTEFCDGRSTMAEQAARAAALGFASLGFSPHSPLPYENDWSMKNDSLPAFFAEVSRLKKQYAGRMEIYAGIEWDLDTSALPAGLDYVIGAVHSLEKNGERFAVDYTADLLSDVFFRLYGGDFRALCADYFRAVVLSCLRPEAQIAAHFDLVMKYNKNGIFINENDPDYLRLALAAIDEILEKRPGMIFEVNTGGMARAGRPVPYPAPALMRAIHERGGRFLLSCDCHDARLLGYGYDAALRLLAQLKNPTLLIFRNGAFRPFPAQA